MEAWRAAYCKLDTVSAWQEFEIYRWRTMQRRDGTWKAEIETPDRTKWLGGFGLPGFESREHAASLAQEWCEMDKMLCEHYAEVAAEWGI